MIAYMTHSSRKILLIKHSTGWNVDRVGQWMQAHNQPYEWCYPAQGDAFPEPETVAAVVSFGGAVSANDGDTLEWVRTEHLFIEQLLKHNIPFTGICLGGQMLARILGSPVGAHPSDEREVGFHRIFPTEHSGDFLTKPLTVMQWHSEGFDVPADCVRIAEGEVFPNQAFRYGDTVYGLQFHPEVNPAALAIWQQRNRQKSPNQLTDEERLQHMREAIQHDAAITEWTDRFLSSWVASADL